MIIEGLLTTATANGEPHVAPIGPVVNEELTSWTLRPYKTSQTYENLRRSQAAIFHITDDVLAVAQAVIGSRHRPEFAQHSSGGWIIPDACRWFELRIVDWDLTSERSEAKAEVVDQGELRPFWGWNRAKHAVLEAAILATRKHLLAGHEIEAQLRALEPAVRKTAGEREALAWQLIIAFLGTPLA